MDTAIVTTLIASASAVGGVLIKMAYDATIAHKDAKQAVADRFLDERKSAYDRFWTLHKAVVGDGQRLHDLCLIGRAGKKVKPEVIETFPESSMAGLVASLDELRRIAHTNDIVKICERIVALHGDASAALRHFLDDDTIYYGMYYFLANRLREDQELEFISAYRKDLGIGLPVGASEGWPKVRRPLPLPDMEGILHGHVKHGMRKGPVGWKFPMVLTEKDVELINSPRFQAVIADEDSAASSID